MRHHPNHLVLFPLREILYLYNTIIHHFYPPKNLHRHCFRFPMGHLHVTGEIAHNDYAKFWGVKEVYYGICASREYGLKVSVICCFLRGRVIGPKLNLLPVGMAVGGGGGVFSVWTLRQA